MQWPLNISPLFLKSGKGCEITDVDNNKYIDYLLALMPIIIGYANKEIDQAVYSQARKRKYFVFISSKRDRII